MSARAIHRRSPEHLKVLQGHASTFIHLLDKIHCSLVELAKVTLAFQEDMNSEAYGPRSLAYLGVLACQWGHDPDFWKAITRLKAKEQNTHDNLLLKLAALLPNDTTAPQLLNHAHLNAEDPANQRAARRALAHVHGPRPPGRPRKHER